MLFLSCAFSLLIAATTANAAADADLVRRVPLLQERSFFEGKDDLLGIFGRQSLNGTGGGSCPGLSSACSAAQGGGCCPFMQPCCGQGCCPKHYFCAIEEDQEKPCKCTGYLCPDDNGGDGGSGGSGGGSGGSGGSGSGSGDGGSGAISGDSSGNSSDSSSSSTDNTGAGSRLSSIGVGLTMLAAGLVVFAL